MGQQRGGAIDAGPGPVDRVPRLPAPRSGGGGVAPVIGSRTGAVLAGGTAAAVLIMTWLPIPFGAFATAAASDYVLMAAIVAVLVTGMRT